MGFYRQVDNVWRFEPLDTNGGVLQMNDYYHIIWEDIKKKEQDRPYLQIPLPIPSKPEEKPVNNEKDKEKRGVYIFQM